MENKNTVKELFSIELSYLEASTNLPDFHLFALFDKKNWKFQKIMEGIECIEAESDLFETYGIWNESCSSKIFLPISQYAP